MTNCEPVARRKLLTCQIYGSLKFVLLSRFGDGFTVAELEQLLLKVLDAVFSVNEAASFQNVFTKKRGFHWKTLFRFQSFQSQIKHLNRLRSFKTGLVDTLKEFQFMIFPKSKIRKFIFFSIFVSVFSPNLTENEAPRFPFLAIGRVWAIWPPQIPILPNSHFIASA